MNMFSLVIILLKLRKRRPDARQRFPYIVTYKL